MAERAGGGEVPVTSTSGKDTDPSSAITELLASWDDSQLLQLTDFYWDRLEQAMEGGVQGVSLALTAENQFSGEEHRKISNLADKGERADSSKLLLSLVMEKGSRAQRVMWETFVKMRIGVPKLDKVLKEIQEYGCDPSYRSNPAQGLLTVLSELKVRGLEKSLCPFPHQTTCRVIDWVKEEIKRQSGNTGSEAGKRSLLNTLHYLFESQNRGLAQATLGSVETLSFHGMTLTPIDCAVLSHVIGLCDTIKRLDLERCHIQCEGLQRLGPGLHKCQKLRLGRNKLGDSGVKLVSAALRNPECKIQKLELENVGLTDSGAEDLVSALSTNTSLTVLDLSDNKLGVSGVKLVSAALRNPECKIQKLWLGNVGLTDSGAEDLVSALSTNPSLSELDLGLNSLTDRSVPALRRLILTLPSLKRIWLWENQFSETAEKELRSLQEPRPGMRVYL